MLIILAFAFMAGCITILSPCILSIAPILLATGTQHNHQKSVGIIIGLIISFSFFTLSFSTITRITGISPDTFRYIALGIIIFFGLTMIIPWFERLFLALTQRLITLGNRLQQRSTMTKTEFLSGFLLGTALGLIWTPCAGPILGTITALAATEGPTLHIILITLAYSSGAALPMFLLSYGGTRIINSTTALIPYAHTIRQLLGIIIIASAVAIMFHADIIIQQRFAHLFPKITLENSPTLTKELRMFNQSAAPSSQQAPELIGITDWINSQPLTIAQLKGKVVLIDFWTYTCINCIRTLPHVQEWHTQYKDKGLVIIGIHTPEFAFEKNKSHVQDAVKRFNLTYPIALDSDYATWRAYNNHYWPAHYLIDQQGNIVKSYIGEGNYVEIENDICALLQLPACSKKEKHQLQQPLTPETYLGSERGNYSDNDRITLQGTWTTLRDHIHSDADNNAIILNFVGSHVYLVMQAEKPQLLTILLDGKPLPAKYYTRDINKNGTILVDAPRAYELINLNRDYGQHTLTIQCSQGLKAYVFTFGGNNL
jgi:cytochrome c biogenesis protein CcdA/thiol-disulfide isomerase/thioredoxin